MNGLPTSILPVFLRFILGIRLFPESRDIYVFQKYPKWKSCTFREYIPSPHINIGIFLSWHLSTAPYILSPCPLATSTVSQFLNIPFKVHTSNYTSLDSACSMFYTHCLEMPSTLPLYLRTSEGIIPSPNQYAFPVVKVLVQVPPAATCTALGLT